MVVGWLATLSPVIFSAGDKTGGGGGFILLIVGHILQRSPGKRCWRLVCRGVGSPFIKQLTVAAQALAIVSVSLDVSA